MNNRFKANARTKKKVQDNKPITTNRFDPNFSEREAQIDRMKSKLQDEANYEFIEEMLHYDYVIEFYEDENTGKFAWDAAYVGDQSSVSNFNIYVDIHDIRLIGGKEGILSRDRARREAMRFAEDNYKKIVADDKLQDENMDDKKYIIQKDKLLEHERKGIGTEEEYERNKARLAEIQDLEWNEEVRSNKKIGDSNMIKLKAKLKVNDGKKVIDRDPFKNVTDELIWMAQSINTIKVGHIISEYQSTKPYEVLEVTDNPDSVELKVRNVSTGAVEMRSYPKHDGVDLLINRRTEKPHKMNDWYGDDEPRVGYYEVLWYEGETADDAVRGDFLTKEFKDKSKALEFYNSIKDDSDKHMFWVSSRTRDGEFIDDIILEDEDGGNIIDDDKLHDEKKVQDNLEEIHYLRDRIYEYERKGIGSEEEYEAWKVKLEQLLDMEDNEEKHIYEFPELTDEDKEVLEDYNLTYLGHEGENCIVEGYWDDLDDYTQLYLGYEMHPDHLYEPGEYQGKPKMN